MTEQKCPKCGADKQDVDDRVKAWRYSCGSMPYQYGVFDQSDKCRSRELEAEVEREKMRTFTRQQRLRRDCPFPSFDEAQYEKLPCGHALTHLEYRCGDCSRELEKLLAERNEYGYSQQTVDALSGERDKLKASRDALREVCEYAMRHLSNRGALGLKQDAELRVDNVLLRIRAALEEKG